MEFYYHGTDEDVMILSADGGLSAGNADLFVDELGRLVDSGLRKLVIDCTKLGFISSYGISVLLRIHFKMAKKGGDVKLASLEGKLFRLLEMSRLHTVFEIYRDKEAAARAFRAQEESSE